MLLILSSIRHDLWSALVCLLHTYMHVCINTHKQCFYFFSPRAALAVWSALPLECQISHNVPLLFTFGQHTFNKSDFPEAISTTFNLFERTLSLTFKVVIFSFGHLLQNLLRPIFFLNNILIFDVLQYFMKGHYSKQFSVKRGKPFQRQSWLDE